jgi:hypothetical protein
MRKLLIILVSFFVVSKADAQIQYGFDYKDAYQSFTHLDDSSAVIIALYNSNLDTTRRQYSAILSVNDVGTNLTAKNGTHFSMPNQQLVKFEAGQVGYRNEILVPIKPVKDLTFFGERLFELNLTSLDGFTSSDLTYGHSFITVVIDYDNGNGGNISVPRVNKNNYTIYPNPSAGNLFISGVDVNSIKIRDLTGKTVLAQNTPSNEINIESLPTGMYFLNAMSDKGLVVHKVFKQ